VTHVFFNARARTSQRTGDRLQTPRIIGAAEFGRWQPVEGGANRTADG
jgi:hypothetical protein